jgi:hypothetical protein
MKKISTAGARQTRNFRAQKLTIGLDLGIDRAGIACWSLKLAFILQPLYGSLYSAASPWRGCSPALATTLQCVGYGITLCPVS